MSCNHCRKSCFAEEVQVRSRIPGASVADRRSAVSTLPSGFFKFSMATMRAPTSSSLCEERNQVLTKFSKSSRCWGVTTFAGLICSSQSRAVMTLAELLESLKRRRMCHFTKCFWLTPDPFRSSSIQDLREVLCDSSSLVCLAVYWDVLSKRQKQERTT